MVGKSRTAHGWDSEFDNEEEGRREWVRFSEVTESAVDLVLKERFWGVKWVEGEEGLELINI